MDNSLEALSQRFLKLATRLRQLGTRIPSSEGAQISPSHLSLLEYVATSPGCGIREIADGLKLSPPTVSVSVRQLEKMGWLARQPHPSDRRAIQLFLTPSGENIYQQAHAFHRRKFEQLLQGLTPEERDTLLILLERAINAAESNNE